MRISTQQQFVSLQQSISAAGSRLAEAQRHLASGKRLERPSDDALATLTVLALRSAKGLAEQHRKNAEIGQANMKLSEAALSDIAEIIRSVQTLVVRGASDTMSQEGRRAISSEIQELKARLVNIANSVDGQGKYFFAGFEVETKPFVVDPGTPPTLTYQGDAGKRILDVGPGLAMEGNILVDELVTDAFDALTDAQNRLDGGDLSGLSGVTLQLIEDVSGDLGLTRGDTGARIRSFEDVAERSLRRMDEFTVQISDREDADVIDLVVQLRTAETAYQAALSAFTSTTGPSLLNFLRG